MRNLSNKQVFKALLLAGGASTFVFATPAFAQETGAEEEDRIVVTGSRISRQDFEANSPIVTIDETFLQQSSTAALEVNLNRLPQFTPAKTPTAGGDIQPTATNTPGSATVALRGLGANRTLVLLDGRRATPGNATGVVDINSIPSVAIARVETISGGASSTYGADAVAGVTNFVLKRNFEGLELDSQFSISQEGDGFEYQLGGIMGTNFADGRGNISIAMSMNTREASFQRDRGHFRDLWADPSTTGGSQFFINNPGVAVDGVNPATFFGIFDDANPVPQQVVLRAPGLNPALNSSYTCVNQTVVNPIDSGICVPINVGTAQDPFVVNVLAGLAAFTVYANPDGTAFTGTGFANRGGASRYAGPLNGFDMKLTDAGTLSQINNYSYLNLPLTRYNFLARGNYEINDWIGVFGQGYFSQVETSTRQEGSPIVGGWSVSVPYGDQTYLGDSTRNIPSSLNADGSTNAAYLAGGRFGLTCPTTGGCPTYQVFPLPGELATLMRSRTNGPGGSNNANVSLSYLFPELRETFTDVTTYNLLAGFEGSLPGTDWTWEAYVNHGESSTFARQTGVNSLSRLRYLLTSPNYGKGFSTNSNVSGGGFGANFATCTTGYNIFAPAESISQDCRDATRAELKNRSTIRQTIAEANVQGGLFELPAGELRFAAGVSFRETDFEFINDTLTSQGISFLDQAQGIYPSGDSFGQIDVHEFYGELLVPVLSDIPFIQEFNLELGGRISDYSTTGSSYTYKILGDWSVTDWLRVRGGFNRAERAPNIAELFLAPQQTFAFNSLGDLCSERSGYRISADPNAAGASQAADIKAVCTALINQDAPGGAAAYYGRPLAEQPAPGGGFAFPTLVGNPNLAPETANTWTAGFVVQSPSTSDVFSRLRLSVDWFNIKINDAIGFSPGAALQQCLDPFFNPLVSGAAGSSAQAAAAAAATVCDAYNFQAGAAPGSSPGIGNILMTYTNAGQVDISGIDAQLDWAFDVGPGTINLNLVANYYLDYVVAELASNPLVDYTGTFGTTAAGLNAGSYEYRILSTLGYSIDAFNIALQWQHLPSVEDTTEAIFPTPTTGAPSYNLFALYGNYSISDAVNIRFGVDNLFDKSPPYTGINTANTNPAGNGQLPGGNFNSLFYDINGRRFSLGANFQF